MQTSPADSEAEIPSVDKALPDSEIFRRLEILHDEQKELELEILLRDLSDVRIARNGRSWMRFLILLEDREKGEKDWRRRRRKELG
ncbi:MAG: hypothetical protein M1835_003611 [Candelina submexicana]|nr:MAG: hypothetical protein M1835_003611 [Candelina submexicana]